MVCLGVLGGSSFVGFCRVSKVSRGFVGSL